MNAIDIILAVCLILVAFGPSGGSHVYDLPDKPKKPKK